MSEERGGRRPRLRVFQGGRVRAVPLFFRRVDTSFLLNSFDVKKLLDLGLGLGLGPDVSGQQQQPGWMD